MPRFKMVKRLHFLMVATASNLWLSLIYHRERSGKNIFKIMFCPGSDQIKSSPSSRQNSLWFLASSSHWPIFNFGVESASGLSTFGHTQPLGLFLELPFCFSAFQHPVLSRWSVLKNLSSCIFCFIKIIEVVHNYIFTGKIMTIL